MSDYSTFKNELDIVEALTKRLDRLTGFDAELDNILGGRGEYDSGHSLYLKHDLSGKHGDISEIYMSNKSFINNYQNRSGSFKNDNLFISENINSSVLHQQCGETGDTTQLSHQNSSQGSLKEQSCFTTLEEVQQKHNLTLSPLHGCTLRREETASEQPLHSGQVVSGRTVEKNFGERVGSIETFQPMREMFTHNTSLSERSDRLMESKANKTQPSNSFSTIEEVRDIQHIKLSPLEGCSLNSQVTTTEFSPQDYLTLNSIKSSENNRTLTSSEQDRTTKSSEHHTVLPIIINSESTRGVEKWKDLNRDEMSIFNPAVSQPSNSFSTIEEVRDIQHIKLSPLEGCSLNSQVTTTEFSPQDYLTLNSIKSSEENRTLTSSEQNRTKNPLDSEQIRTMTSLESEQNRTVTSLQSDHNRITTSLQENTELPISVKREFMRDEKWKEWNRDEMSMFNPDIAQPSNSFSTIEEVRDIQHIKLSPLEGCSLNSQVTTTEFSPQDYLTLNSIKTSQDNRTVTSSKQNRTMPSLDSEQNRIMKLSDHHAGSDVEKWKDWNRDEMSMFNPDISQPSNSFSTIEEVRNIQHIKLSPLEGCSLNSQVTTTELSPQDYLTLNSIKSSQDNRTLTSSEQNRTMIPLDSEQNRTMTPLDSEQNRTMTPLDSEQNRTTASLEYEQNRTMTSLRSEQDRNTNSHEQNTELPISVNHENMKNEKWKEWNKDEMSMFNPDIAQPSNSFSTIEEVRDIQHIKLSPLEGCSLNSQVTTTEFSPQDYLRLSRTNEITSNELDRAF